MCSILIGEKYDLETLHSFRYDKLELSLYRSLTETWHVDRLSHHISYVAVEFIVKPRIPEVKSDALRHGANVLQVNFRRISLVQIETMIEFVQAIATEAVRAVVAFKSARVGGVQEFLILIRGVGRSRSGALEIVDVVVVVGGEGVVTEHGVVEYPGGGAAGDARIVPVTEGTFVVQRVDVTQCTCEFKKHFS